MPNYPKAFQKRVVYSLQGIAIEGIQLLGFLIVLFLGDVVTEKI